MTSLRVERKRDEVAFFGNINRHLPFFLPNRLTKTFFSRLVVGRHPSSQFGQIELFTVYLFVKIGHHNKDLCLFRQANVRREFDLSIFNGSWKSCYWHKVFLRRPQSYDTSA